MRGGVGYIVARMLRVQSLNEDLMSRVILVYPGTKFWVREGENGRNDGVFIAKERCYTT